MLIRIEQTGRPLGARGVAEHAATIEYLRLRRAHPWLRPATCWKLACWRVDAGGTGA